MRIPELDTALELGYEFTVRKPGSLILVEVTHRDAADFNILQQGITDAAAVLDYAAGVVVQLHRVREKSRRLRTQKEKRRG